ncbi:STAS domain-containing protein [Streptomyces sp. NPDC051563]|uniref:STAS domain-containing protein n=1 Tax=Streptomyces sp. NPDC051563 TaxID=3365659 RepID=UPI00378D869E
MTEPTLRIRVSALAGTMLLTVSGEIDLDTAPQLQDAVDAARPGPGRSLLLDMSGVDFCDCSGLTVLMRAGAANPGSRSDPATPWRQLRLSGLYHEDLLQARHPEDAEDVLGRCKA